MLGDFSTCLKFLVNHLEEFYFLFFYLEGVGNWNLCKYSNIPTQKKQNEKERKLNVFQHQNKMKKKGNLIRSGRRN